MNNLYYSKDIRLYNLDDVGKTVMYPAYYSWDKDFRSPIIMGIKDVISGDTLLLFGVETFTNEDKTRKGILEGGHVNDQVKAIRDFVEGHN